MKPTKESTINYIKKVIDSGKVLQGKTLLTCLKDSEYFFDELPKSYQGVLLDTLEKREIQHFLETIMNLYI